MEFQPLNILLADDDEADRLLFTDAFSELDIKTVINTVKNGIELMERLRNDSIKLPDLLFLDLNMPGKSGLDCLKDIRSSGKLNDIMIVIYSTSGSERDIEDTFLSGANVYITKPDNFNVLRQTLQKVVSSANLYNDKTLKRENFLLRID